jgi:5-methylcytosine-specific restriction endonuclease McrA
MPKKRRNNRNGRFGSFRNQRNYQDPAYAAFRKQVRDRDDNKCQFPGCNSKSKLEVHHIKKWASHPSMRYDVTNGITLCKKCHNMVKNNEEVYESLFYKLLEWKATKKRDEDV